jgi:hypothetical protein
VGSVGVGTAVDVTLGWVAAAGTVAGVVVVVAGVVGVLLGVVGVAAVT